MFTAKTLSRTALGTARYLWGMKNGPREEWEVAWKVALCLPSLSILGTEVAAVDRAHPSLLLKPVSSAGAEAL